MTDEREPPAPPTPWGAPPPETTVTDSPPPTGTPAAPSSVRPGTPAPSSTSPIWSGAPVAQAHDWAPPGRFPGLHTAAVPPRWYPLRGVATALAMLLSISVAIAFAAAAAALRERQTFDDTIESFSGLSELADAERLTGSLIALGAFVGIAVAVLLVVWMWRAAKDLEALGRVNPTLGAGWAIGGWFVPVGSLVLPCIVAVGLWKGSDATIPGGSADWKRAPTSPLVALWWMSWIVATVLGVARALAQPEDGLYTTAGEYFTQNALQVAWLLALMAAGVLCAFVVRRITARFEETLAAQQAAWRAAQAAAASPTAVG